MLCNTKYIIFVVLIYNLCKIGQEIRIVFIRLLGQVIILIKRGKSDGLQLNAVGDFEHEFINLI